MVARAAAPDPRAVTPVDRLLVAFIRLLMGTATLMLLVVSLWLLARRMAGSLQHPLPLIALLGVALLTSLMMASGRYVAWQLGQRPFGRGYPHLAWWLFPTLGAVVLAWALSIPGTGTPGVVGLWLILALGEAIWWSMVWRVSRRGAVTRSSPVVSPPALSRPKERSSAAAATSRPELLDESARLLPTEVCQQVIRSRGEQAQDVVSGLLRAEFQAGERAQSLHVAFCPPMDSRPLLEVVQLEGPVARVKAADVQPYGVRIDVRLSAASSKPEMVLVQFEARTADAA